MKVIIDRFEEDFAVVEINGDTALIDKKLLPGAAEGDFVVITIDKESAELRGKEVKSLFERLKKK